MIDVEVQPAPLPLREVTDEQLMEMWDVQPASSRVLVEAYLPHVLKYNDRFDPMRSLVYSWPGGPLAVGDIVLCPKTPKGPGPFEAIVTCLDASEHPYKGPVKSIIRKVR